MAKEPFNHGSETWTKSHQGSKRTRAQAIAEGLLIEVGSVSRQVGFKWPVALTSAAWNDCVAWSDDDSRKQVSQSARARLYDVLYFCSYAVRTGAPSGDAMEFHLERIPRDGRSTQPSSVLLCVQAHPGDQDEPVLTISLPLPKGTVN